MQREQDFVEQAIMLQDVDPGIDADQKRGPERNDHQHHRDPLPAPGQPRHAIGDGVADDQQDRGRDHGDDETPQIGKHIEIVGDQQAEIIQRQLRQRRLDRRKTLGQIEYRQIGRLRDRGLRQADLEHEAERHQEEQHHPQIGQDRGEPRRAREDAAGAHCSSTTQSSGVNHATTRWLAL